MTATCGVAIQQVQNQIDRGSDREPTFISGSGAEIMTRGAGSYDFDYEPPTPGAVFEAADSWQARISSRTLTNNEFRALIAMPRFADRYVYVTRRGRRRDPLALLGQTTETVALYEQLGERSRAAVVQLSG